jgi:two-component system, OmpR family, sensor histidine kinase MprB
VTSPFARVRAGVERADRSWRDLPLRTRLTSAAALATTLTIVAVVATAYIAVRHELRGQIDSQLRRQAGEIQVDSRFNPFSGTRGYEINTGVGDIGGYSQVVAASGVAAAGGDDLPVTRADVRVASQGRSSRLRDAEVRHQHVRLLTVPLPHVDGYAVQIALPLTAVDRQLHTLALFFLVLAVCGLGLTVVTSWGAVRRTMRPVKELTETAERIATTRDLTVRIGSYGNDELGRLAATFNSMLDELQRSLGAQRQLIMDASHELRTPLASLRTNVEILDDIDRLTPAQRQATLAGIVSQLEELTGLVADVVELARGEAPSNLYDDLAFDELVERAVDRARRHWPAVMFHSSMEPVQVRGVATRLDRAVANMLDNAGKFGPPGADVDVQLSTDGTLSVADRGPGVPDQSLPFVFDRFYRADEARALPGSGLGLAIVKQVVDEHGGTISLANRPGGGAVATMTVPTLATTVDCDEKGVLSR